MMKPTSKITTMNNIKSIAVLCALMFLILAINVALAKQDPTLIDANLANSYLSSARKFFDSGMEAHQQAQTYSSLMPNEDPRATRMLRDSINKATDLINNYRENGLSNMPNLPNLPGLNILMRLPDKLLRAELSMLQDEIRMAQAMMQNPLSATMNAPRDLAAMFARMAEQLEQ